MRDPLFPQVQPLVGLSGMFPGRTRFHEGRPKFAKIQIEPTFRKADAGLLIKGICRQAGKAFRPATTAQPYAAVRVIPCVAY